MMETKGECKETFVMLESKPNVGPSHYKLNKCRLCTMGFMCALLTFALCATAIVGASIMVYTLANEEITTNTERLEGEITQMNSDLKDEILSQNTKYDQLEKGYGVLKIQMKKLSAQNKKAKSNKPHVSKTTTTTKPAAFKTTTTTHNTSPNYTDYYNN